MTSRPIRPDLNQSLGDAFDRIRGLERLLATASIKFNIDNEGGWLFVVTNDSIDNGFGTKGLALVDASGDGFLALARDVANTKQGSVSVKADEIQFALSDSLSCFFERSTGTFTIYDSSNNPLLRMTDGSPDLHIPTGGSVVADL